MIAGISHHRSRRSALAGVCLVSAFALLMAASLAISGARSASAAEEVRRIRAGVSPDYPPVAFQQDGEVRGIEADLAFRLEADFGVEVEFVPMKFDELIPALEAGKIDVIMSGMSITIDRRARVDFTDSYKEVGQMALIRKKDRARLSNPAAMKAEGVRVGVQRETTGELYARGKLEKASIKTFESADRGIAALRKGEVDYFIHDAPTIWHTVGRPRHEDPDLTGLYRLLTEEHLAWAVKKDNGELRGFLNAALAHWKQTGEIDSIVDRWITVRRVAVDLNP
jgi:ABC-type amino acid transport substrate-binding protein